MGLYLENYRALVGTWAAEVSWRSEARHVGTRGYKNYIGAMTLCAAVLATALIIGGVEINPGPVDNVVHVLCSACDKNLKSGTQCDSCGSWYLNSRGNVKFQVAESGKWSCERCRNERLPVLEEKLGDAQFQIEELKRINKALEEQINITGNGQDVGKRNTETGKPGGEKWLVMGDSIVRNVGEGKANMRVECFPGIRNDQLKTVNRATERRDLRNPDDVVIHVGTNEKKI
jgi:hypothetical protein